MRSGHGTGANTAAPLNASAATGSTSNTSCPQRKADRTRRQIERSRARHAISQSLIENTDKQEGESRNRRVILPTLMTTMRLILVSLLLLAGCAVEPMQSVRVAPDHEGFVLGASAQRFVPWGQNYAVLGLSQSAIDHGPKVEQDLMDFTQMRANVIRIHLQFLDFMTGPGKLDPDALARLTQMLKLAEKHRIYLDITAWRLTEPINGRRGMTTSPITTDGMCRRNSGEPSRGNAPPAPPSFVTTW